MEKKLHILQISKQEDSWLSLFHSILIGSSGIGRFSVRTMRVVRHIDMLNACISVKRLYELGVSLCLNTKRLFLDISNSASTNVTSLFTHLIKIFQKKNNSIFSAITQQKELYYIPLGNSLYKQSKSHHIQEKKIKKNIAFDKSITTNGSMQNDYNVDFQMFKSRQNITTKSI